MFFHKDLNIQDGMFNLPGIVYHVKNGNMDVFAFKGKRPVETTPLFRAPFFNVTGSSVCLGSILWKSHRTRLSFPCWNTGKNGSG